MMAMASPMAPLLRPAAAARWSGGCSKNNNSTDCGGWIASKANVASSCSSSSSLGSRRRVALVGPAVVGGGGVGCGGRRATRVYAGRQDQQQQQQGRTTRGKGKDIVQDQKNGGRNSKAATGAAASKTKTSTAVGTPAPLPGPPSPGLVGGVVFIALPLLGAWLRDKSKKRMDLDLQRKFRGELIRRRLKRAVGRNWQGQTVRFGQGVDDSDVRSFGGALEDATEVDYSGDKVLTARDIAFARTRGFVRADKSKGREEDYELLLLYYEHGPRRGCTRRACAMCVVLWGRGKLARSTPHPTMIIRLKFWHLV